MDKNIMQEGLPAQIIEYINSLEAKIEAQQRQIEQMLETLRLAQKARFGSSSEKMKYVLTDVSEAIQETLFNEAEVFTDEDAVEPVIKPVTVNQHTRKPRRTKEELAKNLPVHKIVIDIPEEERICDVCETDLKPIGEEFIRRELSVIPAQAYITETYRRNYGCDDCIDETDEANISKPQVPVPVVKRGLASPSSVAYTMYQKYVNAQPLYRQQKDWENFGVEISRGTLANWIIYSSKHWLAPLWEAWKVLLLTAPIIFADETVLQVLKEPGKTPQSESRMWVYGTGNYGPAPITLFDYQPSRSGEHARNFLQINQPFYLQTDAYAGYDKVVNAILCGCYSHLRRKFNEAMPKSPPKDNPAYIGLTYCQKLFTLEAEFASLSPEERLILRWPSMSRHFYRGIKAFGTPFLE
jgi:transposase